MEDICFICNKDISIQERVVVKRGMDILKAASIERNDGKYEILKDLSTLQVHKKCRQKYILKKSDKIFVKQSDASIASTSLQFSPTKSKIRKSTFDFENKCLFCGLNASEDYERKQNKIKRRIISYVKKPCFKDTVTNILSKRHDAISKQICKRIGSVIDLVVVNAKYHKDCYASTMIKEKDNESSKGRPQDENVANAMDIIYWYIENYDDCQFTLQEFKGLLDDYILDDKTIKSKLIERYGRDNIVWSSKSGSPTIICFRSIEHEVLSKSWYESKLQNEKEERLRILKAAASIIRQDIRSQVCQNDYYPPSDNMFEHVNDFIPASLDFFTKEMILKDKKGDLDNLEKKCTAINHAIMYAIRSRSFISPLQIGLVVMLHRKFASKRILDILSHLGLCSSYKEAMLYQVSSLYHPCPSLKSGAFAQYVFDNADFNINTIDGLNTFHSMGGIKIVTPLSAIERQEPIYRLKVMPTAQEISLIDKITFELYENTNVSGLKNIKVQSIDIPHFEKSLISNADLLWIYAKWKTIP